MGKLSKRTLEIELLSLDARHISLHELCTGVLVILLDAIYWTLKYECFRSGSSARGRWVFRTPVDRNELPPSHYARASATTHINICSVRSFRVFQRLPSLISRETSRIQNPHIWLIYAFDFSNFQNKTRSYVRDLRKNIYNSHIPKYLNKDFSFAVQKKNIFDGLIYFTEVSNFCLFLNCDLSFPGEIKQEIIGPLGVHIEILIVYQERIWI